MERSLGLKLAVIGVLIAVLLLGLYRIGVLVQERQLRRDEVVQDIARSSSYAQQLTGPILVVPYVKTVREWKEGPGSNARVAEERQVSGELYFLPETFKLDGDMRTERRARGIYEARLYHANLKISSSFEVPAHYGVDSELGAYRFGEPVIALGISDIRGIEGASAVLGSDKPLKLIPGARASMLSGGGVHAAVPALAGDSPARLEFVANLSLQGTSEFHVVPVGRESQISLTSNWPYPSFTGQYLPVTHRITADGFSARWAASFFSTNLEEALDKCVTRSSCEEFNGRQMGLSFVDPVDQYSKSDRATKYALLFIVLTFAGFFLFEVLKSLAVHPVQYGLVGAALALFYLLLLSLSEHVGFAVAYIVSSAACVALIGFYVSYVLRSAGRGVAFGSGLALLYASLYGLLNADDFALLIGSVLVFALLAAVMVLTRNVNWSSLGAKEE